MQQHGGLTVVQRSNSSTQEEYRDFTGVNNYTASFDIWHLRPENLRRVTLKKIKKLDRR